MKKVLTFALVLAVCFSTFATINLTKDGSLTLDIYNADTLYEESAADPYGYVTKLGYKIGLKGENSKTPKAILGIFKDSSAERASFYKPIEISDTDFQDEAANKYLHLKPAMTVSLLRFEYETEKCPKLQFEVNVDGYLDAYFAGFGENYNISTDGSYFIGGTFKALDKYALRVGLHHFSGHYGDEVLEDVLKTAYTDKDFVAPVEYVRDNSWLISASADVPFGFRVYASLEAPMKSCWLRPLAHCPSGYQVAKAYDMIDRIASNEGIPMDGRSDAQKAFIDAQQKDPSYKALRAQFGFEWEYEFNDLATFFAADLQLHQDGKTMHQPNGYSKDNKWEPEINVAAGIELYSALPGKNLGIGVEYNNGRFSNEFFYNRLNTVTVGIFIK